MKRIYSYLSIVFISFLFFTTNSILIKSRPALSVEDGQESKLTNQENSKSRRTDNSLKTRVLYSRGNDDPSENSFETAKVELILECKSIQEKNTGKVKLKYIAHPKGSPKDVGNILSGPLFRLEEDGKNATHHSPNLNLIENLPEGPEGNILWAELTVDLPINIWNNTKQTGKIHLATDSQWYIDRQKTLHDTAIFTANKSLVQQTIDWSLEINELGEISQCKVNAFQHLIRDGGVETPLVDITSGNSGYPVYPGIERS